MPDILRPNNYRNVFSNKAVKHTETQTVSLQYTTNASETISSQNNKRLLKLNCEMFNIERSTQSNLANVTKR